jgi:hypothetical protein
MNNSNYKNKYLKYKNKYLQQKELKGGSSVGNKNSVPTFNFKIPNNTSEIKILINKIMDKPFYHSKNNNGTENRDIFENTFSYFLITHINSMIHLFRDLIKYRCSLFTYEFTHIYLCTIINLILITINFTDTQYITVTKIYDKLKDELYALCTEYNKITDKTSNSFNCTFDQKFGKLKQLYILDEYITNKDNIIADNINILAKYITSEMRINTTILPKDNLYPIKDVVNVATITAIEANKAIDAIKDYNYNKECYRIISHLVNLSQIAEIAQIAKFKEIQIRDYMDKLNTVIEIEQDFSYEKVMEVFEKCSICIDDNSHLTIGSLFEYLNSLNTTDNKCKNIMNPDHHHEQPRSSLELSEFNIRISDDEIIVQMNIDLANFIIDHIKNMVGLLTYLIINVKNLVPDFIRIYLCFIVNLLFIIQCFGMDTYYELGKNTDLKTALSILYLVAKNHDNFYFINPIDNIHNSIKLKIHKYNETYKKQYSISDTINTIFSIIDKDLKFDTVFYNRYKNKLREIGDVINQNDKDDTIKININTISTEYSKYIGNNNNASISYLFDFLGTFIETIGSKPEPPKIEPSLSTQIFNKATKFGNLLKTTMSNSAIGNSLINSSFGKSLINSSISKSLGARFKKIKIL